MKCVDAKNLANMNFILLKENYWGNKDSRTEVSKEFYSRELRRNNSNEAKVWCTLKNNLDHSVLKILMEDIFPGTLSRIQSGEACTFLPLRLVVGITRAKGFVENTAWTQWILYRVKDIASIYIDLLKDIYLVITIGLTIAGFESLRSFPTGFTSVVVYCLAGSIIIPVIISSLLLAQNKLNCEKENSTGTINLSRKIVIYVETLTISIFNPLGKH